MMKMILFGVGEFWTQCKTNTRAVVIIILSLAITFCSSLILLKAMMVANSNIEQANEQKRAYDLNMEGKVTDNSISDYVYVLDELLYSGMFPKIKQIDELCIKGMDYIQVSESNYIGFNANILLNRGQKELTKYDEKSILFGKWFSDQELEEENPKIVLSESLYTNIFSSCPIGGQIELIGNKFTLIGVVAGDESFVSYSCIKNLSNFVAEASWVYFERELSTMERERLQSAINRVNPYAQMETLYEKLKFDYYSTYILYSILIALVMFLCICNMVNLFRYLAVGRMYEYNIYKICGMKKNQLKMIFYMQILFFACLGICIGEIFYKCSMPMQHYFGINTELLTGTVIFIIVIMIILLLLSTRDVVDRIVKRPPVNRIFWR